MKALTTKELFLRDDVKRKFQEMLGKRAPQFITSVLQAVASNHLLKNADPMSVCNSAAVAATLDLPLNNNLGFAYIIPYNQKYKDEAGKWHTKQVAQFQIGYKGFIQLAQRSGQFQTIDAKPVYEGQIVEDDTFTGYHFNWRGKKSDKIVGYAAYFKLLNGFEKIHFMTTADLEKHGKQYSQTFKKDTGLWKDEFGVMATKTVLKLLLSKYAPLSVQSQMETALITDQSLINNPETLDITYPDNGAQEIDKEAERVLLLIGDAASREDLDKIKEHLTTDELKAAWKQKATGFKALPPLANDQDSPDKDLPLIAGLDKTKFWTKRTPPAIKTTFTELQALAEEKNLSAIDLVEKINELNLTYVENMEACRYEDLKTFVEKASREDFVQLLNSINA